MNCPDLIGQVLDGKYRMTRELGRGGMGAVYLATHLGTERPVAVKVIAPQFMERAEFVERFRREARAAGRLRHPNVVNVTDFGFAASKDGQVAYLVMEYLDGCTLGEILDEEKNLPVGWTLDILDQVCSAVQEAHEQGIIHRDLKPDNIWLEPNQRGGYTVKVLDFGIAKLEEQDAMAANGDGAVSSTAPTYATPRRQPSPERKGRRRNGAHARWRR
jgi:serine/threonine-protein kinase